MATVSVIIPCCNAEAFIEDALRSVLAQTFGDFEIIAVDDGSADGTRAILERYAAADPRVRTLYRSAQGGPSGSRNAGIAASTAPWIALLDADDLFMPERLEVMLAAAGDDVDFVADDQVVVSFPDNEPLHEGFVFLGRKPVDVDLDFYIANSLVAPHALRPGRGLSTGYLKPMIRRSFLERTGVRYDERYRMAEDFLFYFESLAHGARMRIIPAPMYVYRRPQRSLTRSGHWALDSIIKLNSELIERYGDRVSPTCKRHLLLRQRHFETEREFNRSVEELRQDRSPAAILRVASRVAAHPRLLQMAARAALQRFNKPRRQTARTSRLPT